MTVIAAPFAIAAGLVAVAGLAKLRDPTATAATLDVLGLPGGRVGVRLLGAFEVLLGAAAVIVGGWATATLLALLYLGFVVVVGVLIRRDTSVGCGCFGRDDTPVTRVHLTVNCACTVLCAVAAGLGVAPLGDVLGDQPAAGIPMVTFVVSGVAMLVALLTIVPRLDAPARPTPTFALRADGH